MMIGVEKKAGIACAVLNLGCCVASLASLGLLGMGSRDTLEFLMYGVFAIVAMQFHVWRFVHHVLRVLSALDIGLSIGVVADLVSPIPLISRIFHWLMLPCAIAVFVFTTLSLMRPRVHL